jgi:hypothetical protein
MKIITTDIFCCPQNQPTGARQQDVPTQSSHSVRTHIASAECKRNHTPPGPPRRRNSGRHGPGWYLVPVLAVLREWRAAQYDSGAAGPQSAQLTRLTVERTMQGTTNICSV